VNVVASIFLRKLTTQYITRERGAEAYHNLAKLGVDSITVDFNSVPFMSYSFLDEMVLRASKDGMLEHITFKADDESVLNKLAHIAGTRGVHIPVTNARLKTKHIRPKKFPEYDAVFAGSREDGGDRVVRVKKLAPRFLTRDRGREAYEKLEPLKYDTLTIDLNGIQLISYSFLDEIVLRAAKADRLKNIIFKTGDDYALDKLAHIAGTRRVNITVNNPTLKIQSIEPLTFTRPTAIYAGEKAKETPTDKEDQPGEDDLTDAEDLPGEENPTDK